MANKTIRITAWWVGPVGKTDVVGIAVVGQVGQPLAIFGQVISVVVRTLASDRITTNAKVRTKFTDPEGRNVFFSKEAPLTTPDFRQVLRERITSVVATHFTFRIEPRLHGYAHQVRTVLVRGIHHLVGDIQCYLSVTHTIQLTCPPGTPLVQTRGGLHVTFVTNRSVVDVTCDTFADDQNIWVYSVDCFAATLIEAHHTSQGITIPGAVVWFVDDVEAADDGAILVAVG